MTPAEFKSRFISLLPDDIPDDLDLGLDAFVLFPAARAATLRIPDADRAFLTDSGLPEDAAPFFSFGLDPERALMPLDEFPDSVMIGHNGCGDAICVDQAAGGAVVYYNHDNHMQRILMNSSISTFAASLCAYSSFMRTKDADAFRNDISTIDPAASGAGSFWLSEMENELAM